MLKFILWVLAAIPVLIVGAIAYFYIQGNNQDVARFALNPQSPALADADDGVLIFGASRNTGLDVAEILAKRGDKVTALVRPNSNTDELKALNVTLVTGDALDMPSVQAAFAGKNYRAVITTIACISCDPKPDYLGNRNIFDAAKAAGVRRVILVTTIGSGDSYDAAPAPAKRFLKEMLPLKTQAEDHLKSLGLDYTIIRPGGLKTAPATGRGLLTEDRTASGIITRADLAKLIVAALDDPATIGKTLSAIDAEFKFPFDMF
ncbi:MAG: SDR family oxidoreductase [Rhodospirillaceae bacterium]|nr:SDR family oxidoreductase [Rhodospirillaceae bacterium]